MVNPIRGPARSFPKPAGEKKSARKMDPRVKKVLKQSQVAPSKKSKGLLKATKKAATLRKLKKIKAYLARPEEKKHSKFLKKQISRSSEKKKSS